MIYLDNAATSLLKPPEVARAVADAVCTLGNAGRGAYAPTLDAARMVYQTREKLAQLIHAEDPSCIAFACNATDGLNAVLQRAFAKGDHVITTVCEHNSVLRPLYIMQQQGVLVSYLPTDSWGQLVYGELEKELRPATRAVVVNHASNVTGNAADLCLIAKFAKKHGLLLIVDGAQTAGSLPIDVRKTGIDILCFTGHKGLLGPQGIGGVYVRQGLKLSPFKAGGSGVHSFLQEQPGEMPTVLEAGTLNAHGIAGLNAALEFILKTGVEQVHEQEMRLLRQFYNGLTGTKNIRFYGNYAVPQRAAIAAFNIHDLDSSVVSDILWEEYGICVRGGIHCAPLLHKAFQTEKQGMVRCSFGFFNTEEEVEYAVKAVKAIAAEA